MNVLATLRRAFRAATPEGADPEAFADAVRPATSDKFGDYQANGCLAIANAARVPPRPVAEAVRGRLELSPLADPPEVAGPGFLNVRLRDEFLSQRLGAMLDQPRLGLAMPDQPLRVVIDFSSPNVAKPMHVGHIRSTVIGDSLARLFAALGHEVTRDNHLGDWGAQFGMILHGYHTLRDDQAYRQDPVAELSRLYKAVQAQIKPAEADGPNWKKVQDLEAAGRNADAAALFAKLFPGRERADVEQAIASARTAEAAARAQTVKLHEGDAATRALWAEFMPHCLSSLDRVYERLNVRFDVQHGESHYDSMLAEVVADLDSLGLVRESEGALVADVAGLNAPMIVRKSNGTYNYSTTDLATVRYRAKQFRPDLMLYVVDARQSEHFKAVFDVARRWGYGDIRMEHVAFGTILGPDSKPLKTREGDSVGLESLLDEAVARARQVVDANSPELAEGERAAVAEAVGLGAIKYADLSQNRLSDYKFDWDKMLAMNGNTATYLQYAHARTRSVLRKGEVTPEEIVARRPTIAVAHPAERALAVALVRFPEVVEQAALDLKPNMLTDYLFDLANRLSRFWEDCPVLKADSPERRDSRLALCELTGRALRRGLDLLGIAAPDRL